jgi:hypothetical protein
VEADNVFGDVGPIMSDMYYVSQDLIEKHTWLVNDGKGSQEVEIRDVQWLTVSLC